MFGIFVSIIVKPEHREQFLATMEETARLSVQEEAGCTVDAPYGGAELRFLYSTFTRE